MRGKIEKTVPKEGEITMDNDLSRRKTGEYQFLMGLGELHINEVTSPIFIDAVSLVYAWVYEQAGDTLMIPRAPATIDCVDNKAGLFLGCIHEPEKNFFTMQFSHTCADSNVKQNTEVEIKPHNRVLMLAVKTEERKGRVNTETKCEAPGFLSKIIEQIGLWDGKRVEAKPWRPTAKEFSALTSFIIAEERQLPILCISQAQNPGVGINGYMLPGYKLAKQLYRKAHVIELEWNVAFDYSKVIESRWSCFNAAVRIYWPGGINFTTDDPYAHPLYGKQNLYTLGTYAEEIVLRDLFKKGKPPLSFVDCGIQFYMDAQQARLAELKSAIAEVQQYQRQVTQVYEAMREYRDLAEDYYEDLSACTAENIAIRQQAAALTALVARQRAEIISLRNGEKEAIPTDLGYGELTEWVAKYYPDKLFLHPRAVRALKDAVYENPSLVYQCLILLATDYNDYRHGLIDRDEFLNKCREIDSSLQETDTTTDSLAGEQGKKFFLLYKGKNQKLERHLKKGVSRNPQLCLRIYFFWDEEASMVVIGSLPGHLRTRES